MATAGAVGLAIIAAAVYYRFSAAPPQSAPIPAAAVAVEQGAEATPAIPAPAPRTQIISRPPSMTTAVADRRVDLTAPDHADYVQERKTELLELTTSRDPAALPAILSTLNDPDPEIRQAALSATVQVGNKDAIPVLQNQLAWADDPREKVAIQDAIDFLQLPPADQIKSEAIAAQTGAQPPSPAHD